MLFTHELARHSFHRAQIQSHITKPQVIRQHRQDKVALSAILPEIVDYVQPRKDSLDLPVHTRARLEKAGIDLSQGYPVGLGVALTTLRGVLSSSVTKT
jgi:hypothetical protein